MDRSGEACKVACKIGCQPVNDDFAGDLARQPRVSCRFPSRATVYHRAFARPPNARSRGPSLCNIVPLIGLAVSAPNRQPTLGHDLHGQVPHDRSAIWSGRLIGINQPRYAGDSAPSRWPWSCWTFWPLPHGHGSSPGRGRPVSHSGVLLRHTCHHTGRRAFESHLIGYAAQRVVDVLKGLLIAGAHRVEVGLALGHGAEAISGWSVEHGRTAPPQTNHNQAHPHHEPHIGQTVGLPASAA